MGEPEEIPVPGVRGMDHTADVGLEIRAPDLPGLFLRAALGALWLVLERPPMGEDLARSVELVEEDLTTLLRSWLRTVLFWEDTEGFVAQEGRLAFLPTPHCQSPDGQALSLQVTMTGVLDDGPRVREVKGVTLHGLQVERTGEGWLGTVIFDV